MTSACETNLPALPNQENPPIVNTETALLPANVTATATPNLPSPTETQPPATLTPTITPSPEASLRFAIIGDFGLSAKPEADVAALIQSWSVDLIITTGDNNYPDGTAETIDENIGQYFHEFIYPYRGSYGAGADRNRFFPTLGNHDWRTRKARPHLDYFTLPGNERYYDFVWGPVHFFALDSDSREPDGVGRSSVQAQWLQNKLSKSTSVWKIVYMHHPPYSSAFHGSIDWAQWPYQHWDASIVISGHDHVYERLLINDFPYIVNGLGGGPIYAFSDPIQGSMVRYQDDYGAMLVEATNESIHFQFITRQGEVIDDFTMYPAH
ncbi:MAG: metallophosphoesterase [Chloroflexi bacterium]|nr:metallophosphoesterase [Chloroflexota bacterium]